MERRDLYSWGGAFRVLTCLAVCLLIARTLPVTGQEPSSASPTLGRPLDAAQGIELLSRGASLSPLLLEPPSVPVIAPPPTPSADMPVASVSVMAPGSLERGIHPHWASMRDLFVPVSARELDKPRTDPSARMAPTAPDEPVPPPIATFTDGQPPTPVATMGSIPGTGSTTEPEPGGSGSEPAVPELPDFHEPVVAAATPTEIPIATVTTPQPDEGSADTAELVIEPPLRHHARLRLPRLTGVMVSSDHDHMAILDGSIVRAGDFVGGFKVKKITRNSVVLKGDGEERVVYVNP